MDRLGSIKKLETWTFPRDLFDHFISPGRKMDMMTFLSPLQKCESTWASFFCWLDWKSKHFNWNANEWKRYLTKFKSFQRGIVQMGAPQKWEKFHTNPCSVLACLPNPYKLSILGDIWRATILLFSSSKYFYSW